MPGKVENVKETVLRLGAEGCRGLIKKGREGRDVTNFWGPSIKACLSIDSSLSLERVSLSHKMRALTMVFQALHVETIMSRMKTNQLGLETWNKIPNISPVKSEKGGCIDKKKGLSMKYHADGGEKRAR